MRQEFPLYQFASFYAPPICVGLIIVYKLIFLHSFTFHFLYIKFFKIKMVLAFIYKLLRNLNIYTKIMRGTVKLKTT